MAIIRFIPEEEEEFQHPSGLRHSSYMFFLNPHYFTKLLYHTFTFQHQQNIGIFPEK